MKTKELNENVKMFLFGRWMSTCYADTLMDENGISDLEPGFDGSTAGNLLNMTKGDWWKKQLEHFNNVVYPNYEKNGTVKNTEEFLKEI